jgi:flagellar motor protein MotB
VAEIAEKLRSNSISSVLSPDADQLTIHLSDQVYASRQFAINNEIEVELGLLLDTLSPFKDRVRITFIGHSDNAPLQVQDRYLSSNLDLSSLRASRATSFAVGRGFDIRKLAIEAVGLDLRNSRTLSIKVVPIDAI